MNMADIHGSPGDAPQMPAAPSAGPAPVPYGGTDYSPQSYGLTFDATPLTPAPSVDVMSGVTGAMGVQESGYAHDMNAGLVTPYVTSDIKPIVTGGDPDAGGQDIVSGTVQGAVDARVAWYTDLHADILPQGTSYGDLMHLPANSMDPAVGVQGPEGGFYDPPRDYQ